MDGNRHRRRRNLVHGLLIVIAVELGAAGRTTEQPSPTAGAVLLTIDGAIGPATTGYVQRGFRTAVERKAGVIVLQMDTPGGLDTATVLLEQMSRHGCLRRQRRRKP
jgi:membrane-bound serine protease (ClpP class)